MTRIHIVGPATYQDVIVCRFQDLDYLRWACRIAVVDGLVMKRIAV